MKAVTVHFVNYIYQESCLTIYIYFFIRQYINAIMIPFHMLY